MSEFEIGNYIYIDDEGNKYPCKIVQDDKMPNKVMVIFDDDARESEWPEVLSKHGKFEKV